VSEAIRSILIRTFGFPAEKLVTIHNGVAPREFQNDEACGTAVRARLGLRSEEFVVVCTSRLSQGKGIDALLLAVAQVMSRGMRCRCLLVGDGPLRGELERLALHLGLTDYVSFEGFHEDVRPYLHAGSAFVLTSNHEGFGIAIIEAMAAGLPCLVTNSGGPAEIITNGVDGLVVAPGAVGEIAAGIMYLASHPEERTRMGRQARFRACQAFDIEERSKDICHVLLR
jgi:glycosyltransferase involved in cell wall biosynthesis